jgi:hypothetical protein
VVKPMVICLRSSGGEKARGNARTQQYAAPSVARTIQVASRDAHDEAAPWGAQDKAAPWGAQDKAAPWGAQDKAAPWGAQDEGESENATV